MAVIDEEKDTQTENEDSSNQENLRELSDAENTAAKNDTNDPDLKPELGSFYNPGSSAANGMQLASKLGNKKILLTVLGPILLIILILFMMSALKIPNYAANIAAYRLARTAMDYSKTASEIDSEKLRVETADDTKYKALKDKYSSVRGATWGKFDQYRPELVYKNLKGEGAITYETEKSKRLGVERTKITAVVINGERIPVQSASFTKRFGNPVANYRDRIKAASAIQANVDNALKGSNTIVRSNVAKKIRADLGIKLRFWEKGGSSYRGLSAAEADRLLLKESREKITTPVKTPAVTQAINDGTDAVEEAVDNCVDTPKCADELSKGTIPNEISTALSEAVDESAGQKIVGTVSLAYAIAVPACMIYDGSIDHGSDAIDAQSASALKTFYALQTADAQYRSGDTSAEAAGALTRKIGSGQSVVDQYMSGKPGDSSVEKSPQAGAQGDFTLINAMFENQQLANLINGVATPVCKTLTNIWVGAFGAAASAAATLFSGGTLGVTQGTAQAGIKTFIGQVLKRGFIKVVEGITTKEGLKATAGFAKKFGRDFIAIEGATVLAKLLVLSRSGLMNDGATSTGAEFKNQADMGGVIQNNQFEQQMLYGAPMTSAQVALVDAQALKSTGASNSLLPGPERYFGITSPLTKLRWQATNTVANIQSGGLVTALSSFNAGAFGSLFNSQRASADDGYGENYGIVQWGWSPEEQAVIENDASYGVLENEVELARFDTAAISSQYGKCFTATVGELLRDGDIVRTKTGDIDQTQGLCSPKNLGPKNEPVFRWRLSQKRLAVLDHNLGIQNPTEDNIVANQCTDPTASNKNLVLLGDSLSEGMKSAGIENTLKAAGWNPTVIAKQGEPISWGVQQVGLNNGVFSQAGVIVIELGTNDGNTADLSSRFSNLYSAIRNVNQNAKIYWVNYVSSKNPTDFQAMSTKLATFAGANNISIINWSGIGTELVKQDTAYGVHPYKDYDKLVNLVANAIQSSPGCSTTSSTGWVWPIKKESLDNWSTIKRNEQAGAGLNQCWLHFHIKGDGTTGYHAAIDIDVDGKPVYAAKAGKIITKANDGYNTLIIDVGGGLYAVYEHMSLISVKVGDSVTAGQQIGTSGDVGSAKAPHLHFGISTDKNRFGTYADPWATVNPLDYLPNDYSPALLKDDDGSSCLTKDIKGQSGYGFAQYAKLGTDPRYK